MNALRTTFRTSRVVMSINSRNSSTYKHINNRCKAQNKKNNEKCIEYRNECWRRHNKKNNKNIIVECNDLNDWETEKANQHTFKN
jgi:hypothetical protein